MSDEPKLGPAGATLHYQEEGYYVSEMVQNVSGQLPNDFKEWPAVMQDRVQAAMEYHSHQTGRKYELYKTLAGHDVDTGWYVIVIIRAPAIIKPKVLH